MSIRRAMLVLAVASAALLLLGLMVAVLRIESGKTFNDLTWRFDLSGDSTVPTWFSAAMLAFAGLAFLGIGRSEAPAGQPIAPGWWGLGSVCLLMSVDEVATFHEWTGTLLEADSSGLLTYTWVLFGAAVLVALVVAFWRFVRLQPAPFRRRFLVAAVVYFTGALVVEMINGSIEDSVGAESLRYVAGTFVEEGLEFAGVLLLLHALLERLRADGATFVLTVRDAPGPKP